MDYYWDCDHNVSEKKRGILPPPAGVSYAFIARVSWKNLDVVLFRHYYCLSHKIHIQIGCQIWDRPTYVWMAGELEFLGENKSLIWKID